MRNFRLHSAIAVGVLALASACTTTGGASSLKGAPLSSATAAANIVGSAEIGSTVELPAGNPVGVARADVIAEYFAASNRRCRQVLPQRGQGSHGDVRIACENKDGSWEWVRSLTNSSVAKPLPALASIGASHSLVVVGSALQAGVRSDVGVEARVDEFADSELVDIARLDLSADAANNAYSVNDDETLWKFSRRTTGSGANWQAIAELNDIDDARTVAPGMTLLVPSLLLQGR